jgi:hypothetical protein
VDSHKGGKAGETSIQMTQMSERLLFPGEREQQAGFS